MALRWEDSGAVRAEPETQADSLAWSKRFATDGDWAYCAHCHDGSRDLWHGFPVGWDEVPMKIVNDWIAQGAVKKSTVKRAARRQR